MCDKYECMMTRAELQHTKKLVKIMDNHCDWLTTKYKRLIESLIKGKQ